MVLEPLVPVGLPVPEWEPVAVPEGPFVGPVPCGPEVPLPVPPPEASPKLKVKPPLYDCRVTWIRHVPAAPETAWESCSVAAAVFV
ncbi:MAG: hypothetical protein ABR562_08670 [Thermoplasmatota archaeon]